VAGRVAMPTAVPPPVHDTTEKKVPKYTNRSSVGTRGVIRGGD